MFPARAAPSRSGSDPWPRLTPHPRNRNTPRTRAGTPSPPPCARYGRPNNSLARAVSPCGTPAPHPRRPRTTPSATLIGSVQRAMRLLETVAGHEHGAPAKQLARETGLALPTAYHLLRTLVHEGYLRRDKGLFYLGEAAERLSSSGAQQKRRSTVVDTLAHWRDGSVPPCTTRGTGTARSRSCASPTPRHPGGRGVGRLPRDRARARHRTVPAAQLDDKARRDHLDRYPVQSITPYTVRDDHTLLRRLERLRRMEGCRAAGVRAGDGVRGGPDHGGHHRRHDGHLPARSPGRPVPAAAQQLQSEIGRMLGSLAISISI